MQNNQFISKQSDLRFLYGTWNHTTLAIAFVIHVLACIICPICIP